MRDLFTVLIAEKKYIDAIRLENKLFFEPFLEKKELAFCCWNPQGQTLMDSVPDLIETVSRKREWKAVIVHNCTDEQAKQKNPFDIVDFDALSALSQPTQNPDIGESRSEWEDKWRSYYDLLLEKKKEIYKKALDLPLQKLTTWLSFIPADFILKDVDEKSDVQDWALNELSRGEINPSIRLERLEREQYRSELKLKEMLRREFVGDSVFNIAYPKEIHCISKRTSDLGFFNPEAYWNTRSKNEYSEFCDRNMYFDKTRFLVFDLLPETHANYRNDEIKFLSTLLVFASNDVPGSVMESRRLYLLESENDDSPLITLTTSYDKKLAATYEVINNEIEHIYSEIPGELSDKLVETLFCTPINVEVKFDEHSESEALYPEDDFPILSDSPEDDVYNWEQTVRGAHKSCLDMVRQQRRCVKRGVDELGLNSELSEANVSRLTPFQLDDIRDFTENLENEMVESLPPDISTMSKYEKQIDERSNEVKAILSERMKKSTSLIVTAIISILLLLLYAPFIVVNYSNTETSSASVGLLIATFAVLVVSLIATLIIMKLPLKKAVKNFTATMHNIVSDIKGNLRRYSRYFSLSANVRRGYKVQRYAENNLDEYTKSIRIRRKHQEDIRKKRAELEEMYPEFIADSRFYDNTMTQPYDYDFEKKVEYSYDAPYSPGFCKPVSFLEAGNRVEAPSGYITRISVRMEEIYDK